MSKFQSISLPTLSDSATMKEVENESRKMGLDILNKINSVADAQYPVGATYTQYSGQTAPASLFGGTWTDITATSLPTQIYDSGSNSNGYWIRYTDGTMECWNNDINIGAGILNANYAGATAGNLWYGEMVVTFPQTFLTYSISSSEGLSPSGTRNFSGTVRSINGTTARIRIQDNATWASGAVLISWQAIGKWSSAFVYPVTLWKRTGGSLTTTTGTSVVTGIYDSGTNSNGSWIRFTDGTMLQWGTSSPTFAITTSTGPYYGSYPQNMPISFVDTTYSITASTQLGTYTSFWGKGGPGFGTNSTSSIAYLYFSAPASIASSVIPVQWQAIGKWR